MKRTPLKRGTSQLKRSKLQVEGHSTTAYLKKDIQATLREIVILRDKKCILYGLRCYHTYGMVGIVWQAEHLIERSNTDTFADSRLVVLVCKNCHGWKHFRKSNHDQYDEWVKSKLSKERVELWERCETGMLRSRPLGPRTDLKMELLVLKRELSLLKKGL